MIYCPDYSRPDRSILSFTPAGPAFFTCTPTKIPPAQTNKGDLLTNNKSLPLLRGGSRHHSGRRSDFTAGGTVQEFHLACFPFKLPSAQTNLSLVVSTIPDALKKSQWSAQRHKNAINRAVPRLRGNCPFRKEAICGFDPANPKIYFWLCCKKVTYLVIRSGACIL